MPSTWQRRPARSGHLVSSLQNAWKSCQNPPRLSRRERLAATAGNFLLPQLDQVVDRDDGNMAFGRKLQELLRAGHVQPVATANLAQHGCRLETGHPHQIN